MVAPPWISIPAPTYGGIEEVVRLLCQGLVARGNDVTLYAAPDSESDARVVEVLDESHPDQIEHSLIEAAHVGSVFGRIDRERVRARRLRCCARSLPGGGAGDGGSPAVSRSCTPCTARSTMNGQSSIAGRGTRPRWWRSAIRSVRRHRRASSAATWCRIRSTSTSGRSRMRRTMSCCSWAGSTRTRGRTAPSRRRSRAGRRLALAGPVQPEGEEFFASEVEPHIDDDHVRYLGPLGPDDKRQALARARRPVDADRMAGAVRTGDDRGACDGDAGDRLRSRCGGGDRDRRRERIPRIGCRRDGGGDRAPARDRSARLPQVSAALRRRHRLRRLRGGLRRRHLAHHLGVPTSQLDEDHVDETIPM